MLDSLARDLRLASRTLRAHSGFALIVIFTLALGIGASTAIFSVVHRVLLVPLPFAEPDEVVMVWQNDRLTGTTREASSVPDFYDFEERARSFAALAAYAEGEMNLLREGGEPARATAAQVTHDLISLLGVSPTLGRAIRESEDRPGGARVALLSDAFWQRSFGGDPQALGKVLLLDDEPYEIIGVLPAGLDFPSRETNVWLPLQQASDSTPRSRHWIQVVGRLASGVTVTTAQEEMDRIAADLEQEYSENRARGAFVEPLAELLRGEVRPALLVLLAAVFCVLLIACANVASLLLARGAARGRDLAVRIALGSGVRHLLRQHLIESLLLTAAAAAAGVALAVVGLRGLLALAPPEVSAAVGGGTLAILDGRVLLFTVGLGFVVGIGFSLVPTLQALRLDVQSSLRERSGSDGDTRMRARRLLVVSQMALASILLICAGLLIASLDRLRAVDPGFHAEHLLRLDFELPPSRYPRDFSIWPRWTEVHGFNRRLLERVEALPGVDAAALTTNHPLDPGFTNSFVIVGREDEASEQGELKNRMVSPGYFETAGVPLRAGRRFDRRDESEAEQVLILNQAAIERYFPDGRVLDQRIRFWGVERRIVGIVANEKFHGLGTATPPAMYVPLTQAPQVGGATLMARIQSDPRRLIDPLRDAIHAIDPDLAVFDITTMEETLSSSLARERFTSWLLGLFAAVAVALAAVGVHGVLSYLVTRRRREIGVRMALGASRRRILAMVLSQGMAMAAAGLAIGLAGATLAARSLAGLLFGVSAFDISIYLAVAAALAGTILIACAFPARKATGVDPAVALRSD